MKNSIVCFSLFFTLAVFAQPLQSPDKNFELNVSLNAKGKPTYNLKYKTKMVVQNSNLGLILKNTEPLNEGFEIINTETTSFSKK